MFTSSCSIYLIFLTVSSPCSALMLPLQTAHPNPSPPTERRPAYSDCPPASKQPPSRRHSNAPHAPPHAAATRYKDHCTVALAGKRHQEPPSNHHQQHFVISTAIHHSQTLRLSNAPRISNNHLQPGTLVLVKRGICLASPASNGFHQPASRSRTHPSILLLAQRSTRYASQIRSGIIN